MHFDKAGVSEFYMKQAKPTPKSHKYKQTSKQVLSASPSKDIRQMFDQITPTYMLLNHILSLGCDFYWRRKLANIIDKNEELKLLDMATGTGDLLISVLRGHPEITEAVGLDISENMLSFCRRRITKYKLEKRVNLVHADAANSPFVDETFDVVTMGFGIRNTPDALKTLTEMYRLLKPGGVALILEFSMPTNRVLRKCYLSYLRYFVPLLGRILSGHNNAYRYLDTSIEGFHRVDDFCCLMQRAGFSNLSATPLTSGVVCIYKGSKPDILKN